MGQLTRPAPPAATPPSAADTSQARLFNTVVLGSYLVMLLAMATSVRHVADVFQSLEPAGSSALWGYIPALAVDGGLLVMSFGIWLQKVRNASAAWLWAGFWIFLFLSAFANTDQGVREMTGVETVTLGAIWNLDEWQLAKLLLFKTALPFLVAVVVETIKHLPMPSVSRAAPADAPVRTIHVRVDGQRADGRTQRLSGGRRTALPGAATDSGQAADRLRTERMRQRPRSDGRRTSARPGTGQALSGHASASSGQPAPVPTPVSGGQADSHAPPVRVSAGHADSSVIPDGLTEEHVRAVEARASTGNVREAAMLLQERGIQMGKTKVGELIAEARAVDAAWVASMLGEE